MLKGSFSVQRCLQFRFISNFRIIEIHISFLKPYCSKLFYISSRMIPAHYFHKLLYSVFLSDFPSRNGSQGTVVWEKRMVKTKVVTSTTLIKGSPLKLPHPISPIPVPFFRYTVVAELCSGLDGCFMISSLSH